MSDKLIKRAKRKFTGYPAIKLLAALDSPLKKKYQTSFACSSSIRVTDGKIQSRFCKRTWCNICNPIRVAVRLNNYQKPLNDLGGLHITTLTIPNCQASEIRETILKFRLTFKQYRNTLKKQGIDFKGVYNFETTYNYKTGLYHPHIHIIHNKQPLYKKLPVHIPPNARKGKNYFYNDLIVYWLQKIPSAQLIAQDAQRCFNLIEGFKYQALNIYKRKINGLTVPVIPTIELDQIYQAIEGIHCFQAFGIKKIKEEDIEKQMNELTAYDTTKPEGVYGWVYYDWHEVLTNEVLSDYLPEQKTINYYNKLLKNESYK